MIAIVLFFAVLVGGRALTRLEQHPVDEARLCVYASAWKAFLDRWLFGTGFGTFESVFPAYRDADCGGFYIRFGRAHDFYLEGLVGLGIVFALVLLVTYLHVFTILIKGCKSRKRLRYVPVIGICAVLLVTLHGLVDFSLQVPGMAALFAVFLGAVTTIGAGRLQGAQTGHSQPSMRAGAVESDRAV
jgi:O-antigen ligase